MTSMISSWKIHGQIQKMVKYFVIDENVKHKIDNTLDLIPNTKNVDEYAMKYESQTDDFIRSISQMLDKEREDTLKIAMNASEQVLASFYIRLITVSEQLLKSPDIMLPISLDDKQFFCDYFIKYWRAYQEHGEINLLTMR